jgi:hypothetical protein
MAEDPDLGIGIDWSEDWGEVLGAYETLHLTFRNRKKERRLAIRASEEAWTYGARGARSSALVETTLPPGETTIEVPVFRPGSAYFKVDIAVDGAWSEKLSFSGGGGAGDNAVPTVLVIGVGVEAGEAALDQAIDASMDHDVLLTASVPLDALSRYWQTYAGLPAVVALRSEDVPRLGLDERQALARWVMLGGGTLWLHGEDPNAAMEAMGLFAGSVRATEDLVEAGCMSGKVLLSPNLDALANGWIDSITATASAGAAYTRLKQVAYRSMGRSALVNGWVRMTIGNSYAPYSSYDMGSAYVSGLAKVQTLLLEDLHDVPRLGYMLISFLLALVIGPLNLIVLRGRKRAGLFYLTAPAIALAGMVALLGYTLLDEGLQLKRKSIAVLLHDPVSGQGAVYEAHGTFGGMATRKRPVLPVDAVVVPFASDLAAGFAGNVTTDWSTAQRLSSGWIVSRRLRGLLTITPVRVRMGMKVTRHPGGVAIENGLTHAARIVAVRLPIAEDGTPVTWIARDVQPGRSVEMASEEKVPVPFLDIEDMDWTVAARMEGLPHVDEHGLGGEILEDAFYYVAVEHLADPIPAEGDDAG